jgi:hypothetical protein
MQLVCANQPKWIRPIGKERQIFMHRLQRSRTARSSNLAQWGLDCVQQQGAMRNVEGLIDNNELDGVDELN